MNRITVALLLLLCFAATSVAAKQKSPKGADLLRQLEADFVADVAKHGHAAFLTYFAEDGVELVDGGGIDTKDAMRKQPPWPDGTALTWTPVKAEMAASGDLGRELIKANGAHPSPAPRLPARLHGWLELADSTAGPILGRLLHTGPGARMPFSRAAQR